MARWLRGLAGFDRGGERAGDGAVSTAAWLRAHCRLSPGAARDAVTLARQLTDELPATAAAFAAGTLSRAHARVIATATDGLTRVAAVGTLTLTAITEIETTLAGLAGHIDPTELHRLGAHLRHAAAPQALLDDEITAHEQRRLHLSRTLAGTVAVDGLLDAEGGAVLLTALDALLTPPSAGDLRRPAQRRADALVDLARTALDAAALPATGGERPHLTVTADLTTLTAQSGAAAATWTGAARSAAPPPAASAATPPSPASSPPAAARSSTSAGAPAPFPPRCAAPSLRATAAAPSPIVTGHPPGPRPTTWCTGPTAA